VTLEPRQDDVKKLLHSMYIGLIHQIPYGHFAEFGLHKKMIKKYYEAEKGCAAGFYTKVLDVKEKVLAVTRSVDDIRTPLSKIPTSHVLNDIQKQFILNDYKAVMGEVSLSLSDYCSY
jgi:hypothetical protein